MIQWRIGAHVYVHIDTRDTRGFSGYAKCILKKYLCGCPRAYIGGRDTLFRGKDNLFLFTREKLDAAR